jgi:ABC-2 type transport system permease protein
VQLKYLGPPDQYTLEEAKEQFLLTEDYALLYIPTGSGWDPDFISKNIAIYGKEEVTIGVKDYLRTLLRNKIEDQKLRLEGVDPEVIAQTRTDVSITAFNIEESGKEQASLVEGKMIIGLVFAFFMYFFIFLFGSQVMGSVMEEKSNRVVEVIISSVKPFQLMLGKIVGSGLVGLTQFLIWVVLSAVIYFAFTGVFLADKMEALQQASDAQTQEAIAAASSDGMDKVYAFLQSLDLPVLIISFLFYFLGGFFLYAALFAAVGSAVENQNEAQQFLFPITTPIILSIILALKVAEDPSGPLAFWASIIPFTSPIVMVTRIPYGVPYWELALSMSLLILGFMGTTWLAGRIYRVGILMYGKKVSWSELWKWLRYGG